MDPRYFAVQLIDLYTVIVFIAVITSWFQLPPTNPVARFTRTLTEPVLAPIRKLIPPLGGLDFSPLLLLLLLQFVRGML